MRDYEFTRLLTSAARAAHKYKELTDRVGKECERRYGVHYSDVDADGIIDVLDYLGTYKYTSHEFHEDMIRSGCDRIDK